MYYYILIILFIGPAFTKISPAYIKPCPGFRPECLKTISQQALPELAKGLPNIGVSRMDPLEQNKIELELPGGLKVEFWNGSVNGLSKCIMESVKYKHSEAEIKLHCDLTIKGLYKATGRILLFTLNGDGKVNINTTNIILNCKVGFEDKLRNGILYHTIKDYRVTPNYGGRVTFNITNLLNGNQILSETILAYLNENWKVVAEEFGKPIVDEVVHIVFKNIKNFFKGIPKEELFG